MLYSHSFAHYFLYNFMYAVVVKVRLCFFSKYRPLDVREIKLIIFHMSKSLQQSNLYRLLYNSEMILQKVKSKLWLFKKWFDLCQASQEIDVDADGDEGER